jgi:hypothetical protein
MNEGGKNTQLNYALIPNWWAPFFKVFRKSTSEIIVYAEPALSKCFNHFLFTDNGRDFFAIADKSGSLYTKSICSFHKNLWAENFLHLFRLICYLVTRSICLFSKKPMQLLCTIFTMILGKISWLFCASI